ncbi:MAG: hypothetical protein AAB638_01005 [Patescibacteria group bacterium]
MLKYIKEQLNILKLKKQLRAYHKIDEAFMRSTKQSFMELAKLRSSSLGSIKTYHSPVWKYSTAVMVVLVFMTSGVAVFAEKNDVPINNPLYPLKRLSEKVQLVVSSPEKKLQIHETLVERRLKDIAVLKIAEAVKEESRQEDKTVASAPEIKKAEVILLKEIIASKSLKSPKITPTANQKRIKKLDSDFQKEAQSVLNQADKLSIERARRVMICKGIISNINSGSASTSSRFREQIKARCDEISKDR